MRTHYIAAGESLRLDREVCTGCRICSEVCPHGVFIIEDKKARISHRERCIECGACARNCPASAIEVRVGVGCAAAVIGSRLRGGEVTCGCSTEAGDAAVDNGCCGSGETGGSCC